MEKLTIIKIGGNVIDHSEDLHRFLKDFSALEGPKILVHGGGKIASTLGRELNVEAQMVEGRRITDLETLRIVTMVYAGLINKNLVAQLQLFHTNALGVSGADGNILTATKRPPVRMGTEAQMVDFGYVGDIHADSVNAESLKRLITAGFVPVCCAITHDGKGQLFNTNADTIASALAVAMARSYETQLVYCFERAGVLTDVNDDLSVIPSIRKADFEPLKSDGIIADGMIPKLQNAFEAIDKGVSSVLIGNANQLSLLSSGYFGTKLIP